MMDAAESRSTLSPSRPSLRRRGDTTTKHIVHRLSLRCLVVVPVLLAIATVLTLYAYSDVNVAMLLSQCHARSRLPALSHIPLVGSPLCFLASFFGEALAAWRSIAVMAVVLSFVAGLLTVSTVEAARICNGPSLLIAYPTGPWLVFNFLGGAAVWEIVIIPAFLRRSQQIWAAAAGPPRDGADFVASDEATEDDRNPTRDVADPADPNSGRLRRHLGSWAEAVAIPVAVALGYVLPSVLMLVFDSAAAVTVWLFFPLYVSVLRQVVRQAVVRVAGGADTVHLESHRPSLVAVYAVPILCSVASHVLFLWSLTRADDRREMTRSTLRVIEVDFVFIVLTVLYWVLVETGWRVLVAVVVASAIAGPGAGLCLGWIYREQHVHGPTGDGSHAARNNVSDEEAPLLAN